MTKSALLVFTRAPLPGRTKTRLIPLLGARGAAKFHKNVLQSTLTEASISDFDTIEIWCATDEKHPFFQQCTVDYSCSIRLQQGGDLGARMYNAINVTLVKNAFVVLIGSDCPTITKDIINQSCRHLSAGKDAVLGPTKDGGYYLIGINALAPDFFQDIPWGAHNVAKKTRQQFVRCGMDYVELEELNDIDTPDDYQGYINAV